MSTTDAGSDPGRKRVIVAAPHGFCAGVVRAIDIVERLLESHGPPVYVRKEIVHNRWVVDDLARRGAVFVDSEDEVPAGAVCVFSAHGVSPQVRANAERRDLRVTDATCPLVSKVHVVAPLRAAGAGSHPAGQCRLRPAGRPHSQG
jgi:4-hydroxy-3-methylbut-2-enyl diphosphate reductase